MSVTDIDCVATEDGLCSYPEFDLQGRVDDPDDPSELTLILHDFEDTPPVTAWMTVDLAAAVPLSEVR